MGVDVWGTSPFGALFEIQLGKMLSPKARVSAEPKPYLRNVNVQWNRIDLGNVARMDFSADEREKFALRPGDLLVCEGGEVGRSAIWKGELEECYYQKALHRLRPRSGAVDPTYVLHYLTQKFRVEKAFAQEHGQTTIAHLPKERLERLPVLLPPLAEQRKIAAILSSVDETIEKSEAVIAQLDVVKKAMLEELLTRGIPGRHTRFKQTEIGEVPEEWRLVPLGVVGSELGTLWSDGDWIESKDQDPSGGIRLLQVGNVRIGSVHLGGSPRWINQETFERLSCTEVRPGDILVSRMADPIGRAGIVPSMPFKAVTAVDCAILRVDPTRVVASYIVNYLNSPRTLARVANLATGTTRSRVSRTTLGLLPVPLPALDEQRALAQAFDVVDQRQLAEVAARVELLAIKSALSSALLSGDLRVRPSGGVE